MCALNGPIMEEIRKGIYLIFNQVFDELVPGVMSNKIKDYVKKNNN